MGCLCAAQASSKSKIKATSLRDNDANLVMYTPGNAKQNTAENDNNSKNFVQRASKGNRSRKSYESSLTEEQRKKQREECLAAAEKRLLMEKTRGGVTEKRYNTMIEKEKGEIKTSNVQQTHEYMKMLQS